LAHIFSLGRSKTKKLIKIIKKIQQSVKSLPANEPKVNKGGNLFPVANCELTSPLDNTGPVY
jgi:hypothetical protein